MSKTNGKSTGTPDGAQGADDPADHPRPLCGLRWSVTGRDARFIGLIAALAAGTALALAGAPAGARVVCPGKEKSCSAPSATTQRASALWVRGARLHGVVDSYGQTTWFYFQYGGTAKYGTLTNVGTFPDCPAGTGSGPSCNGEGPTAVSAKVSGLRPDTTYHYQLVAMYPTGETDYGADLTFHTPPVIRWVRAPRMVRGGDNFKVTVRLAVNARVYVSLVRHHHQIRFYVESTHRGVLTQHIRAPHSAGGYKLFVVAVHYGGKQTLQHALQIRDGVAATRTVPRLTG